MASLSRLYYFYFMLFFIFLFTFFVVLSGQTLDSPATLDGAQRDDGLCRDGRERTDSAARRTLFVPRFISNVNTACGIRNIVWKAGAGTQAVRTRESVKKK